MAAPSPESIREHHRILEDVMKGKIDARSQRAQDAYRIAIRYPVPSAAEPAPVGSPGSDPTQRQMLETVFGEYAEPVEQAMVYSRTPTGRKIAGSATVMLTALLAIKAAR